MSDLADRHHRRPGVRSCPAWVTPLGALHHDEYALPKMRFTLGGEEHPFQVFGYSEHRPNRELDDFLLNDQYREMGWRVEWGPEFMSEKDGYVRTFRLTNRPEPLEQDQTYFALVRSEHGEFCKSSVRLVEAGNEEDARKTAIADEVREDSSEFAEEWERSVTKLVQVPREEADILRRYLS